MISRCQKCKRSVNTDNSKYYTDVCGDGVLCSLKCARQYFKDMYHCETLKEADNYMDMVDMPLIKRQAKKMKEDREKRDKLMGDKLDGIEADNQT